MLDNIPKGIFLSIEGIDGSGKSTLIVKLKQFLQLLGHDVYRTKEPGDSYHGSFIGFKAREILFSNAEKKAENVSDLLFLADHIQNVFNIEKALQEGKTVISDRYADSQFAYTHARYVDPDIMDLYKKFYGPKPDLILYLKPMNIDNGWTLTRANARKGLEEGKQQGKAWNSIEDQLKVAEGYNLHFERANNVKYIHIRESDTEQQVFEAVIEAIFKWF